MSKTEDKFNKRRLRGSYVSVVVSISLVLTLLGLISIIVLKAKELERNTKENYTFTVLLKDEANQSAIRQFMKELDVSEYVKTTQFISKEEAAEMMKEELDQDFLEFFGSNPLPNAIDINLKAEFVESSKLNAIKEELQANPIVNELAYDADFIEIVTDKLNIIITYLLAGAVLLLLIAIALINSSIRLTIYSKRFIIKTMQLVGATRLFIQKPFMARSLKLGLAGSIIAIAIVLGIVMIVQQYLPDFITVEETNVLAISAGVMVILGMLISWVSTLIAVNKYLNLNTDEIHF
ncbi:MAG: permease-like cell division protein FtsX [Schleiferiaceae bacterium]|nr:permease-like cell division protein FtsX [Schleiferiaceae bacterium]